MKQQLEQRLQSLKSEFESGQKMLADLEAKQANLRDTLLRISGAIQVIEEELSKASEVAEDNNQPPETVNAEVVPRVH
jgi:predicted  nucleic acid-binding Zn-ribbon protein